ncbi:hypothetical protein ABEB36_000564 [Hypothenemus hampei]|uniref:Uncharacterized protein n=1 Tax=Hypothenemus hampei TaxID=57062 RepID=A0ABD1FEA2_HYPHA
MFKIPIILYFQVLTLMSHIQHYAAINNDLNKALAPLDDLGARISEQVHANLQGLDNLGSQINQQVQENIHGLDNLGSQISQSVYESLEPVRALEIKAKLKNGIGGVTLVTYQPSGRTLIIKNSNQYICRAEINITSGTCKDQLIPFEISEKSDWCLTNSNSHTLANNQLCLSTSTISVIISNSQVTCSSPGKLWQTSLEEYRQVCSPLRTSSRYRYIPDVNNPFHIKVPNNDNKFVKCENSEGNYCLFQENNKWMNIQTQQGFTIINSVD